MKIKLYSHVVENAPQITMEQAELLENTGLLDACDEATFCLHFDHQKFNWLGERWQNRNNVKFHFFNSDYKEWHEQTTLHKLQEDVHSNDEEYYVLYIHHKGAFSNQVGWRKYMEYFCIERWKECIEKLDEGYETCGASFLNNPPHPFYAGNFFWARASYLRRCKRMKTPPENNFQPQFEGQPHMRFDSECWHGSGNPKWYDMHPGPDRRWYWTPSQYRNDMSETITFDTTR
jgi:hypothetical protein